MPFSEEQRRINLRVFKSAYIDPAVSLYLSSQNLTNSDRAYNFALGSILEGLGWLILGSAVGYFEDAAYTYITVAGKTELRALFNFDQYFGDWEYLFDPYWVGAFKEVAGGSKPRTFGEIAASEDVVRLFQASLIRALGISQHPSAKASTMVLNFDRARDIKEFVQFTSSFEKIADAVQQRSGLEERSGVIRIETIFGGYGLMVQYVDSFRTAYYSRIGFPHSSESVSYIFRRVAQLQAWRFHFIAATSLAHLQEEFISRYLDAMEITSPERQREYFAFLKDLVQFWRGLQTPRAMVTGGH
jgi:hypothetical protein